jgi:RNA polymerase sigma-70 factor (ECF subfamily)
MLYEATSQRLFGYLLARLGEPAAAEDLLQDVYLAALQGIDRFRGQSEGEFIAWILKIARAKLADRLRSRYRHPELIRDDVESPGLADDPLQAVDQRQQSRELAEALSRLTPDQRDVVVSRMVMGLDLEQTAKVLGKNVGSIKSLQHRALAQLARILQEGKAHGE